MKNKGFTLIELLAVIVILAIIALIATPIVLGIIEDSRNSSNEISAGYIVEALEKSYSMAYALNQGATPTLEQVKEQFSMSNATWGSDNHITTQSGVDCVVTVDGTNLSISCPDFPDIESTTMSIVGTTQP